MRIRDLRTPSRNHRAGSLKCQVVRLCLAYAPRDSSNAFELGRMIEIAGGTFSMGSDCFYPEEAPPHQVRVEPFAIDERPVTNAEYRAFVEATGYVTV